MMFAPKLHDRVSQRSCTCAPKLLPCGICRTLWPFLGGATFPRESCVCQTWLPLLLDPSTTIARELSPLKNRNWGKRAYTLLESYQGPSPWCVIKSLVFTPNLSLPKNQTTFIGPSLGRSLLHGNFVGGQVYWVRLSSWVLSLVPSANRLPVAPLHQSIINAETFLNPGDSTKLKLRFPLPINYTREEFFPLHGFRSLNWSVFKMC